MYVCMYVYNGLAKNIAPYTFALSLLTFMNPLACKKTVPIVAGNITVNAPEQVRSYSSPVAQGFLDRLTFANPQNGGNGTGTSFIPFRLC